MSAGHDHGTVTTHRGRLAVAFAITATILVAEVVGAVWTGSLALLVDAGHMLTDAAGLGMALVAASLALRPKMCACPPSGTAAATRATAACCTRS